MRRFRRGKVLGLSLLLVLLIAVGVLCRGCGSRGADLRTLEGREALLRSFGWEIDPGSEEQRSVRIPERLEGVLRDYNELQLRQGFDLREYRGMDAMLYTYTVTNHPCGEDVIAQLLVFAGEAIGGDVHSASLDGFMHGLKPAAD